MADYIVDGELNNVLIQSQTKVTIQVGPNSIILEPTGVTIKCINLTLEAEAEAQLKALMLKEQISGIKDSTIALYKQA